MRFILSTFVLLTASLAVLAQPNGDGALGTGQVFGGLRGTNELMASDRGWYNENGDHVPINTNYICGRYISPVPGSLPFSYRNFFVFDLSSVTDPIIGATLRLYNPIDPPDAGDGFASPDITEIYELHEVTTAIATLTAGGTGLTAIWDDLADGPSFGQVTVSAADNGTIIEVTLNAAAIQELNDHLGGQVAIGGVLATLAGADLEHVFAFSNSPDHVTSLAIVTGSIVPTLSNWGLFALVFALKGVAIFIRRRQISV